MKEFFKKHIYKIVVGLLIAFFIVGFIYGLNAVLAMGGVAPDHPEDGKTAEPTNAVEALEILNSAVNEIIKTNPKTEFSDSFDIDGDSLEVSGEDSIKTTLLFIKDGADDYLEDMIDSKKSDFNCNSLDVLKVPQLTADDIESIECDFSFYYCPVCDKRSRESRAFCDNCSGTSSYRYRSNYTVTLNLKTDDATLAKNFNVRSPEDINGIAAAQLAEFANLKNIAVEHKLSQITFSADRYTDRLTSLTYIKSSSLAATAEFVGDYEPLGSSDISFDITEKEKFSFTWAGLELSAHEMSMEPKTTDNLLATLICSNPADPELTVTWVSSDPEIAAVDDEGYIKSTKKTGKTTIKASYVFEGKTYEDECVVWVKVPVESAKISRKNMTLSVGETATLSTAISPKKATCHNITWHTSDASVVTVDADGNVKAVGTGSAEVYSVTEDGHFKATCEVEVR